MLLCVEMKRWVGSEWILIHPLSGSDCTVKPTRHPHIVQLDLHCILVAVSAGASPLALTNSHPATCGSTHETLFIALPSPPPPPPTSKRSATHLAPMTDTLRDETLRCSSVFTRPTWHLHHRTALGFVLSMQNEAFRRPVFLFSFGTCQYRDYRRRGRREGANESDNRYLNAHHQPIALHA